MTASLYTTSHFEYSHSNMDYGCRPSLWLRKQKYFLLFNKNLILATSDGMQMFGHYRYMVVTSYYATTTNAQRSDLPQLSFHLRSVA